jgi:GNAT superfamily N-acetyltransferase
MWWRLKRAEYNRGKGDVNKGKLQQIVRSGEVPGLLLYDGGEPVAWCSVAPRERFPVLGTSRTLKPVDDKPVWSIVCFYVRRDYRKKGVSRQLIRAAAEYARKNGARLLEGYPVVSREGSTPAAFAWTGFLDAFEKEGFEPCDPGGHSRRIVRLPLE